MLVPGHMRNKHCTFDVKTITLSTLLYSSNFNFCSNLSILIRNVKTNSESRWSLSM